MSIFHFDLNLLWYPPNLHLFFPFCLIFLVSTRYINKDLNDFFFNESFPTIHFSTLIMHLWVIHLSQIKLIWADWMLEKSSGAYDFPLSTSPFSTSKEWFFTLRYKGYEEKTHIRVGIFLKPEGWGGGGAGRLDPRFAGMGSNWNDDYRVQWLTRKGKQAKFRLLK